MASLITMTWPDFSFEETAAAFAVIMNIISPFQLESGEEVEMEEFYVKFKGL